MIPTLMPMVLAVALLRADSLSSALEARAQLGPGTWSRVLRIENRNEGRYPARLHALVFEFDGRLWFYTDTDGTQGFSLHAGRLAEEKADFAPLLREIDPGFASHEDITDRLPLARFARDEGELRNGCFIEALAYYRRRWEAGNPPDEARLLSYYERTRFGQRGHTVLLLRERGQDWVFDPFVRGPLVRLPRRRDDDALTAARALFPADSKRRPVKAVFHRLTEPPAPEFFIDPAPRLLASARPMSLDEEAPGPRMK